MELLKSNPQIDESYQPNLSLNHIDYFSRALKFAQTNYHDHLVKITKIHFKSMVASFFLEEYAQTMLLTQNNNLFIFDDIRSLTSRLCHYHQSFWELNNFPSKEKTQRLVEKLPLTEAQFLAIHETAFIVNQGIKLFGWTKYRDNFLDSPGKLAVLPLLGLTGARVLAQNIGVTYDPDAHQNLYDLAIHFKFQNATEMCQALQKNFPMSTRTIGTILWYSTKTFGTP